jgi:phosphotransferase system IIB component
MTRIKTKVNTFAKVDKTSILFHISTKFTVISSFLRHVSLIYGNILVNIFTKKVNIDLKKQTKKTSC